VGAVRRIQPYGFENQPGNGLADFESETGAELSTPAVDRGSLLAGAPSPAAVSHPTGSDQSSAVSVLAVQLDSLLADAPPPAAVSHPTGPDQSSAVSALPVHLDSLLADALPPAADVIHPAGPDQSSDAAALMEVVVAYPELELYPATRSSLRRASRGRSRVRRRVASSTLRVAGAVAYAPILILGWSAPRLWWIVSRSANGAWRLVAGAVGLVWAGLRAVAHAVVARVPLVRRNMAAAAAAGLAFARAAALGIWRRLVPTVHAIAAGLGAGVKATLARVPLVRRNMAAAAAAGGAFARAAALGVWNRLVRTVQAIAARLGPGVEATVARVPLVRRNMAAAAAAGVAFAQAAALGIRNRLARTVHAIAARLRPGVHPSVARVPLARRSTPAAGIAFAQAVVLGIRDGLVGTVLAIAAGLGPGVRTVAAHVPLAGKRTAAAGVAFAQAAALDIRNRLVRTVQAIAARLGPGVRAAIARIRIVGVTAADKARRGTASAMAFVRTSFTAAKPAAVSFLRSMTDAIRRIAVRTASLSGFVLAVCVRAAGRVGSHLAATAALVGHGVVALARSAVDALRPVPVLTAGAVAEPDFTPVARRALGSGARRPPGVVEDAPAVRVTLAGAPAWARQWPTGRALAIALGLTIGLSLGALLLLLSMQPAAPRTAGATLAEISPSPPAAVVSPVVQAPSRPVSPALVRAIWAKTDTRSLDLAFGALRSSPLALHRCDLLQTSASRAVAHCDEIPEGGAAASPQHRVTWTIKFRRVGDGWVIEDVSTPKPRARARRNR